MFWWALKQFGLFLVWGKETFKIALVAVTANKHLETCLPRKVQFGSNSKCRPFWSRGTLNEKDFCFLPAQYLCQLFCLLIQRFYKYCIIFYFFRRYTIHCFTLPKKLLEGRSSRSSYHRVSFIVRRYYCRFMFS